VIAAPKADIDLRDVARALKAPIRFTGLVAPKPPAPAVRHAALRADVRQGWDAYLAARPHAKSYFKGKRRAARALERDCGPAVFRLPDEAPGLFEFVVARKRAQFRRTGRHDIFACGWTEAFLRRLWEVRTPSFGGRLAALYAGDQLVAAEYLLAGEAVHHLWFPVYDPRYARYGVGALLTVEMLRAAANDPKISSVDFGRAGEAYKLSVADEVGPVYEGEFAPAPAPLAMRAADAALRPLGELRERLRRRLEVIGACETTTVGRLAGAFTAFSDAAGRRAAAA
jgi:CelD/BcsL family acetyltransferase involved in cellulose biosynthesis